MFPQGIAGVHFCDHIFRYFLYSFVNKKYIKDFRIKCSKALIMHCSPPEHNFAVRTLDTDGNGYLDFKEFIMANDLISARDTGHHSQKRRCFRFTLRKKNHCYHTILYRSDNYVSHI